MRAHEFTDQGAAGIVLYAEDTGRYGLQQRSNEINDPGLWAAWGGGREKGETLEQCARRELAEEGGYTGPVKLKRIGENSKYVTFLGIIPNEFEPRANPEWQDYCWVEAGDWPSPMHPGTAAALKNISLDEGLKSKLAGAALAGGMALGASGANAMDWKDAAMTGAMFVPGVGQVVKAYNVGSNLWQAAKAGKQLYDLNKDTQTAQTPNTQQTIATAQPGKYDDEMEPIDPVDEAFNQPYQSNWETSEYGDVDASTRLPDGTYLNIMFNQEYDGEGEEVIQVEFHRNNSQEVTGEGDAQRIFATVLSAIQKYIKKYKPETLIFSASKEVDPGQNSESRAKLYNRLVQRYASSWGYQSQHSDDGDAVRYQLTRAIAENFADGKVKGKSRPGRVKRAGASCDGSVTDLRQRAKNASGEKARMYHWCANMKSGKKKANEEEERYDGPYDGHNFGGAQIGESE